MMILGLLPNCRRMDSLEFLNKELLFHTHVCNQIFITCANIYTYKSRPTS